MWAPRFAIAVSDNAHTAMTTHKNCNETYKETMHNEKSSTNTNVVYN